MVLIILFIGFLSFTSNLPDARFYINDYANLFSSKTTIDIEKVLLDYEKRTGNQILVFTVNSINPYSSIEEYSLALASKIKAGTKNIDNGLLVVIAKEERAVRIEVAYGLESKIPDIVAGRIIRNEVIPNFKNNDYDTGIKKALYYILEALGDEKLSEANLKTEKDYSFILVILFFLFFSRGGFFMFPFLRGFARGGSSSFRGGFGGGAGGSFGGGGASGRW